MAQDTDADVELAGTGTTTFVAASDFTDGAHFQKIRVVDGSTASQKLAIDSSGRVTAKLASNTGVDVGDVDVTSVIPGTAATALGKAEDAAHGSADTGVAVLAVRRDTAAVGSDTDGDYSTFNVDSTGNLWVRVGIALPAGTNAIGKLAANSGVDIGDVDVTSIAAGDNNIGNVDIVTIAAGSTLIGDVALQGRAGSGLTIFRSIDIDESEEEVKATAGTLYSISAFNRTAAPLYLKFYNLTAANTTVGTSTPVLTFVVPANADSDGAGFIWNCAQGLAFDTAISVAATTGIADADTGAPGANDCVINIGYK